MLSAILSDTKPSFLRLSVRVFHARGYIPIFRSTAWIAGLETLELRINISKEEFDYEECFVSVASTRSIGVEDADLDKKHAAVLLPQLSLASLRLELVCANTEILGEGGFDEVDFSGQRCEPYSKKRNRRRYCYTENALRREDLLQHVRDCMRSSPTLRRMTLLWASCDATLPNRVIGIDLDHPPYFWDRPGDKSDEPYIKYNWW